MPAVEALNAHVRHVVLAVLARGVPALAHKEIVLELEVIGIYIWIMSPVVEIVFI